MPLDALGRPRFTAPPRLTGGVIAIAPGAGSQLILDQRASERREAMNNRLSDDEEAVKGLHNL